MHEQARFYSNLYQEDKDLQNTRDTYITDFLGKHCLLPTLTGQEQNLCVGKLQENEVAQALKLMKNGSAPGCDGITTEFYKVFWTNIKSMLLDSHIFSHDKGQVSQTQQRGIISLIHKGKATRETKLTTEDQSPFSTQTTKS